MCLITFDSSNAARPGGAQSDGEFKGKTIRLIIGTSTGGGVFFDQVLARGTAKFEWAQFTMVGSPERREAQLYMKADSPYKTLDDIRSAAEAPRCGGAGTGATGYFVPKILEETVGLMFKLVTGYQSGGQIDLAVERGELNCRAYDIGSFLAREATRTWFKNGFVKA